MINLNYIDQMQQHPDYFLQSFNGFRSSPDVFKKEILDSAPKGFVGHRFYLTVDSLQELQTKPEWMLLVTKEKGVALLMGIKILIWKEDLYLSVNKKVLDLEANG